MLFGIGPWRQAGCEDSHRLQIVVQRETVVTFTIAINNQLINQKKKKNILGKDKQDGAGSVEFQQFGLVLVEHLVAIFGFVIECAMLYFPNLNSSVI